MAEQGRTRSRQKATRVTEDGAKRRRWNWLLLTPLLLLIYPGLYAREFPRLFGFPFFYWYQFAVVILTALLTGLVYWATRGRADADGGA